MNSSNGSGNVEIDIPHASSAGAAGIPIDIDNRSGETSVEYGQ
ncbi:hypothetical protein BRM1_08520 [Brevibacterium sp. BRM-1]|nr:hypothetical protein [Brevibacterium sp. BRM-1]WAL39328.1 hypothetical protein BRM1_08520 [Brevibacterium sp. BRM-1]